jgi:hypothetical protein
MFSMNVRVPANGDREHHLRADGSLAPWNLFGIIVGIVVVVAVGVLVLVRVWRHQAEVKWGRINALRASASAKSSEQQHGKARRGLFSWRSFIRKGLE